MLRVDCSSKPGTATRRALATNFAMAVCASQISSRRVQGVGQSTPSAMCDQQNRKWDESRVVAPRFEVEVPRITPVTSPLRNRSNDSSDSNSASMSRQMDVYCIGCLLFGYPTSVNNLYIEV